MIPAIPSDLIDYPGNRRFIPSEEWSEWAMDTFVLDGPYYNDDHSHLSAAVVKVLLTNAEFNEKGKRILGTAQLGNTTSGKLWPRLMREQQIREWFGDIPDFIITLDGCWISEAEPIGICALLEHELYHCAQKKNQYGDLVYSPITGEPVWDIRPHDIEEFTGVVRRYGSWNDGLDELASAFLRSPEIGRAKLDGICGCGAAL